MRFHHDGRNEEQANQEAGEKARARMEITLRQGAAQAQKLLEKLKHEEDSGGSRVVPGKDLLFFSRDGRLQLGIKDEEGFDLHRHAASQVAKLCHVPSDFAREQLLLHEDQADMRQFDWSVRRANKFMELLNTLWEQNHDKNWLLRRVEGQVRGVLSSSYKPMKSSQLIGAFAEALGKVRGIPSGALWDDTRFHLRAIRQEIIEPIPGEPMLLGIEIRHSDFGNGALVMRSFVERCWCTNTALMEALMKEVHLGQRLPPGIFKHEVHASDMKTIALAIGELTERGLGDETRDKLAACVKKAHEEKITWKELHARIGRVLNKEEQKRAQALWENDRQEDQMPDGENLWAASNLLSLLSKDPVLAIEKRLLLQRAAGQLLEGGALSKEEL